MQTYIRPSDNSKTEFFGVDPDRPWYSVCVQGGRSFVLQWPYEGPDKVPFAVMPNLIRDCKVLGFTRRGTTHVLLTASQLAKYIVEDDEEDT